MPRFLVCLLVLSPLVLFAQDKPKPVPKDLPVVRYPVPLVVPPAAKTKVTLRGAKLDAVTEVKTTEAGITVKLVGKGKKAGVPNNYPAEKIGDTEVEIELDLPKEFTGDTVPLTAVSPGGTSEMYTLTVNRGGVAEKEPNDGFDTAQELKLPAIVDGTVGKEKDADVFRFTGKKGQTVRVAVPAAKLGSPADLLLTVYDAEKRPLKVVDDVDGNPDPSATVTLPADGVYYLSLIEAHDLGGTGFGYRLKVE